MHKEPQRTWFWWKVSTVAKFVRLAYLECEYTYSNRSPSMSLAFALNQRLIVKGPCAPADTRPGRAGGVRRVGS